MGFLSLMGRIIIGLSIAAFPASVYFTLLFSDLLGFLGTISVLSASLFLLASGVYLGLLGVKTDELSSKIESLIEPAKKAQPKNLIKAFCPVDHKQALFVHISPNRPDAQPDRLDLFLGSCGHEVHRGEIQLEH